MKHLGFRMPTPVSITGRSSSITNSFIQSIIPVIPPTAEELKDVFRILGMNPTDVRCAYCGDVATEWDHLRPLVVDRKPTGFISEIGNLVPACGKCNQSKGNRPWRDWIASMAPRSPRTRNVAGMEERIRRLSAFEEWRSVEQVDVESLVPPDLWKRHWENCELVLQAMRGSQELASEIAKEVAKGYTQVDLQTAAKETRSRRNVGARSNRNSQETNGSQVQTIALLRSIGMRTFIQFFHEFGDPTKSTSEIADLLPADLALPARRSRASTGRRVFRERREREALQVIASSTRTDPDVVKRAEMLLAQMD